MGVTHSAFGLTLLSAIPLLGMDVDLDRGLPPVEVEVRSPIELEDLWSGLGSGGTWRGALGDGEVLAIERGRAGDLLFSYGDRASFLLDPGARLLVCAPSDPTSLDWQRVLLTRILPNVSLALGREALHACAVETAGGAMAIAGPSGAGKSTLALELVRRGYRLFADDVVVLARGDAGEVLAHPSGPHMNLTAAATEPPTRTLTELGRLAGERWVVAREGSSRPLEMAAVVLLEPSRATSAVVESVEASPLALAPYMLGLPDEKGRDASRFQLYSDLVEGTTLLRLAGARSASSTVLADALEAAVETAASARPVPLRGAA